MYSTSGATSAPVINLTQPFGFADPAAPRAPAALPDWLPFVVIAAIAALAFIAVKR